MLGPVRWREESEESPEGPLVVSFDRAEGIKTVGAWALDEYTFERSADILSREAAVIEKKTGRPIHMETPDIHLQEPPGTDMWTAYLQQTPGTVLPSDLNQSTNWERVFADARIMRKELEKECAVQDLISDRELARRASVSEKADVRRLAGRYFGLKHIFLRAARTTESLKPKRDSGAPPLTHDDGLVRVVPEIPALPELADESLSASLAWVGNGGIVLFDSLTPAELTLYKSVSAGRVMPSTRDGWQMAQDILKASGSRHFAMHKERLSALQAAFSFGWQVQVESIHPSEESDFYEQEHGRIQQEIIELFRLGELDQACQSMHHLATMEMARARAQKVRVEQRLNALQEEGLGRRAVIIQAPEMMATVHEWAMHHPGKLLFDSLSHQRVGAISSPLSEFLLSNVSDLKPIVLWRELLWRLLLPAYAIDREWHQPGEVLKLLVDRLKERDVAKWVQFASQQRALVRQRHKITTDEVVTASSLLFMRDKGYLTDEMLRYFPHFDRWISKVGYGPRSSSSTYLREAA
jgi:hypothetical protein